MKRAPLLLLVLLALPATGQDLRFVDRTAEAGLSVSGRGRGVAVHDVNGDGYEDVYIPVVGGASRLFLNDGTGVFTPHPGFPEVSGYFRVGLFADVKGDGAIDLFVGGKDGATRLLMGPDFHEVESGIDGTDSVGSAAFGDYDGDGWVDLFVAVYALPDRLYRNRGTEPGPRFEDVSAWSGVKGSVGSVAMQSTWIDYDHDGDLDLFAVHDGYNYPSRLYVNNRVLPMYDGAFRARIDSVGAGNSMGVAWGDFDGDGWEDAYVTRIRRGGLYRNNRDGTFTDQAPATGAWRNGMSWGVVFADFDNDADADLYIVNQSSFDNPPTPFLLYENHGGTFTETASAAGVAFQAEAQSLASGDFNGDGLVDLVSADDDGVVRLLINASTGTGNWIGLRLQQTARAIGARVELTAGDRTWTRSVSGGDSYNSQSSGVLHFGLGSVDHVDTIRIDWGNAVETLTGLAINQVHDLAVPLAGETETAGSDFRLYASTPNPFFDHTSIVYSLDRPASVTLDVVDLLGRRIARLVDEIKPMGEHRVVFHADQLPSGVYLYRLIADGQTETRTLILSR